MELPVAPESKDEIIEELWSIKNGLASSCKQDMGKLVEEINMIASCQEQLAEEVKHRERPKTA